MKLSDFAPDSFKGMILVIAGVFVFGGISLVYYKISSAIEAHCDYKNEKAAVAFDKSTTKPLSKEDDRKDETKEKIYHDTGPNDPVGTRVGLALDSLREPSQPDR